MGEKDFFWGLLSLLSLLGLLGLLGLLERQGLLGLPGGHLEKVWWRKFFVGYLFVYY